MQHMDNLIILKPKEASLTDFYAKVQQELENGQAKGKNVIVDLLSLPDLEISSLLKYQEIAALHIASGCSFVLVYDSVNFNELPESLHVTPTLQEAKDIIQMEDIERDLGF